MQYARIQAYPSILFEIEVKNFLFKKLFDFDVKFLFLHLLNNIHLFLRLGHQDLFYCKYLFFLQENL